MGIRNAVYAVTSFTTQTVLSVQELSTLRKEYSELTDRITRYEDLERTTTEIRQENIRLREQLGFSSTLNVNHIAAEITGRDPQTVFSAFSINKGSDSGVSVDMPVIAFQNGVQGLVGKIIHAGRRESLVMPVYDINFFAAARCSESRYEGIVNGPGELGQPLRMQFVRRMFRDEIKPDDTIITSGMGGVYPAGITIGKVSEILYRDYESSMELELKSSIDFTRLEYVFVIDFSAEPEQSDG
ncbi:cell shape-determining protein MreC [Spirochaetia bacterium]|nr:cell shape-determining protein MreC [Spirochaetia bacterium]